MGPRFPKERRVPKRLKEKTLSKKSRDGKSQKRDLRAQKSPQR